MKKNSKNCLIISIIILMIVGLIFTIKKSRENNITTSNKNQITIKDSNLSERKTREKNNNEESNKNTENKKETNELNKKRPSKNNQNNYKKRKQSDSNITSNTNNYSIMYYLLIGIETFIIVSLSIYLFISKFNSLSLKEVFFDKDKLIITILISLIIAIFTSFMLGKYYII